MQRGVPGIMPRLQMGIQRNSELRFTLARKACSAATSSGAVVPIKRRLKEMLAAGAYPAHMNESTVFIRMCCFRLVPTGQGSHTTGICFDMRDECFVDGVIGMHEIGLLNNKTVS
jgi:hypothetical protein